jgi:hypothetical protein
MNSKLEALISAYQIKPKKLRKKLPKIQQKSPERGRVGSNKNISLKSIDIEKLKKKVIRETVSVKPKRSESSMSLSRYLNSSLEADLQKLDNLTYKNSSARLDWISVKQKIIELGVNKKLIPIQESDEGLDELVNNSKVKLDSIGLLRKYETKHFSSNKERIRSLDNLLLVDN